MWPLLSRDFLSNGREKADWPVARAETRDVAATFGSKPQKIVVVGRRRVVCRRLSLTYIIITTNHLTYSSLIY